MTSVPVPREAFRDNARTLRQAMREAAQTSSANVVLSHRQAEMILRVLESADSEFERRQHVARKLADFSNEIGFTE
ncbi:hypothetical protein [Corynebacterium haemomassiliense]|uniref:Uncharacterized protein n=1 Tax=Corynebacterium haemomassiliense TaxID=2754726 RepID=A0A7W2EBD6_9CORY|nr:hypothetical protein [Corynebacterium haemomassiliense]MBA5244586.1 hypothetical protein [Corynebacterium haemomassiliense]MDL0402689.1 hypothetical protein [Corynebacterium lehmanniae]